VADADLGPADAARLADAGPSRQSDYGLEVTAPERPLQSSCCFGDYAVAGKIREANVALVTITQSYVSLLPPHANKDQENVLILNLRNRMIFRAANEECAKQSAAFIGKNIVKKRSRSVGSRGVTYSYQDTEDYKYQPFLLREMPLYRAVLVHAGRPGQFKRTYLKMLTGAEIRKTARATESPID
jgi:hypothetical protein